MEGAVERVRPKMMTVVAIMAMSALLAWRHQENISRLVRGTEKSWKQRDRAEE